MATMRNGMRPVHPGETLKEDYLKPLKMTPAQLAKALKLPAIIVTNVVSGRAPVTAVMAMRLSRYFGNGTQMNARWWLEMQLVYDLRKSEIAWQAKVDREVKPRSEQLAEEQAEQIRATPAAKVPAPVVP